MQLHPQGGILLRVQLRAAKLMSDLFAGTKTKPK